VLGPHLVRVGDDQDVGKVDGRGCDPDPCLTGIKGRRGSSSTSTVSGGPYDRQTAARTSRNEG